MCKLCDEGKPQNHDAEGKPEDRAGSRRDFLKTTAAAGAAAAGANLFATRPAGARRRRPRRSARRPRQARPALRHSRRVGDDDGPERSRGIRANFPVGDVLVEGKKILAVGPNLNAGDAGEIDARGRIVMPGFIDTHHHQFETALRSFLADGILINDRSGSASASPTYFEFILLTFAPVYRPRGRVHQRAVRRTGAARRRRHDGARRLADPSLAAALGCRHPGAVRHRTPRRLRLFRERGGQHSRHQSRQPVSEGRDLASRSSGSRRATSWSI